VKFSRHNTADHLKTEDDIAAYLEAVMEDGEPALIAVALDDAARTSARIVNTADTKRGG